ncbi:MAG: NfeD family protein [Deltaproteobacteria bacterium]|jgi:membrane-bound ClpP family serine protease
MILMPVIMVSPLLALLLFYYLPLHTALPIYIVILIVAGFCHYFMYQSMRAKNRSGLEAMIGGKALVMEDIDPEGKIKFKTELWNATARGKKIEAGKKVRILGAQGLVLIVENLKED